MIVLALAAGRAVSSLVSTLGYVSQLALEAAVHTVCVQHPAPHRSPSPNPNQVRYVGLTTTIFASRSAYKYAQEKRADAARD